MYKQLTFLVQVAYKKNIHSLTLRNCYFYFLKFFTNFGYCLALHKNTCVIELSDLQITIFYLHYSVSQNFMKIGGCLVTSTFDIRTDSLEIELYVNIVVSITILVHENAATGDSLSQVQFPACQFYLSKFDVTRPHNFHKVLKTSVVTVSFNSI